MTDSDAIFNAPNQSTANEQIGNTTSGPREPSGMDASSGSSSAQSPSVDLNAVRDLVLKANPDVIPEMIAGDSFDAMMASVGPARDAYKRIVDGMSRQPGDTRHACQLVADNVSSS